MYRIENIHRSGIVHRDIKAENMAIDLTGQIICFYTVRNIISDFVIRSDYLFTVYANQDLGTSESYVDANGVHIPKGTIAKGSGHPRVMSLYAQTHREQSRRDDMETIGTVLLLCLHGKLRWDQHRGRTDYRDKVAAMKNDLNNVITIFN